MAQRDPGVDNLENFIATLSETIDKVEEVRPGLREHAQALDALHDESERELGGFDRELDSALAAVDGLADDTQAALDTLAAAARTGADGVLEEATDAFGEWEGTLGGTLDDAVETVNDAARDLDDDGFDEADGEHPGHLPRRQD